MDWQSVWFIRIYNPQSVWIKRGQKKLVNDDEALLTAAEERKLVEDDKELPKEKLGMSHRQRAHTTNNTNTSFTKEKEETNEHTKNSKWTVFYELSICRLCGEKEGTKKKK